MKALRDTFAQEVESTLLPALKRLKFLDESGANLGLTRAFGRATPGQRVAEGTPGISGAHYTLLAALGLEGVSATLVWEGALDREAFTGHVRDILAPTLRKGDIVLMDNLSVHKGTAIQSAIEARGARLLYLPPYSPDLNPIELCWAKVKAVLREVKARTLDALLEALAQAFTSVSRADIAAWFAHCGYALKP